MQCIKNQMDEIEDNIRGESNDFTDDETDVRVEAEFMHRFGVSSGVRMKQIHEEYVQTKKTKWFIFPLASNLSWFRMDSIHTFTTP